MDEERLPRGDASVSFSTFLYAASPSSPRLTVVAMRASMQHLNERQGIFSTEANMQIAAVNSDGKRIRTVVMMAGPEHGAGLWPGLGPRRGIRPEGHLDKNVSSFAKDLYQKLTGNK